MKNIKTILTFVFVAVVASVVYVFTGNKSDKLPEPVDTNDMNPSVNEGQPVTSVPTESTNMATEPTNQTTSKYKDGTYTINTNYFAPSGKEDLGISVSVTNGKVTVASITNMAKDKTSINFQTNFASKISSEVVGQDLEDLKIKVVSGASLTTAAFNKSLEQIRVQAKNI